jgi:hypothetical protein
LISPVPPLIVLQENMKPIITILVLIGSIGGALAQVEKPDVSDKAANAVTRITKSDKPVKWYMRDGWVIPDVKVLRTDGPWAEIEYSDFTPQPPRVVPPPGSPQSNAQSEDLPKSERKRCWINVNHVIRIVITEQAKKE